MLNACTTCVRACVCVCPQVRRLVENLVVTMPEHRWTAARCLDTSLFKAADITQARGAMMALPAMQAQARLGNECCACYTCCICCTDTSVFKAADITQARGAVMALPAMQAQARALRAMRALRGLAVPRGPEASSLEVTNAHLPSSCQMTLVSVAYALGVVNVAQCVPGSATVCT
jgi:hypothetical protein